MVWFKVDDKFHASEPVKKIPLAHRAAAIGLWTLAGAWSADHLKDGYVPGYMVEDFGGTSALAEELVRVGLWRRRRDGFQFNEWAKWQRTREAVEATREAERDRKARWRAGKAGNAEAGPDGVPVGHSPRPLLPDPTRPDPTKERTSSSLTRAGDFESWYATYPRKVGRAAAEKAYAAAVKKVSPVVLLEAAGRFAGDPNLPEKQFIPHPATWLNQGRWEDEPLPVRGGRGGERQREALSLVARYEEQERAEVGSGEAAGVGRGGGSTGAQRALG